MPRRRKIKTNIVSGISNLIMEGKPLKGVKGWIRIDELVADCDDRTEARFCYFPITIKGIVQSDNSCGLEVVASPTSPAIGPDCKVSPCNVYLSKEEIEIREEKESKIRRANNDYKNLMRSSSTTWNRGVLCEYYNKLTEDQRKIMDEEAESMSCSFNSKKTIISARIDPLARLAVQLKHELTHEEAEELSRHY